MIRYHNTNRSSNLWQIQVPIATSTWTVLHDIERYGLWLSQYREEFSGYSDKDWHKSFLIGLNPEEVEPFDKDLSAKYSGFTLVQMSPYDFFG